MDANRNLFALVKKFKNLHVETTDYKTFFGIEEFVNKFGSEKLIYGSSFPLQSMGGSVSTILLSDIRLEDKRNIASENLERIMGGIRYGG